MEDMETQLKIEQLAIKIGSAEHRLAVLNEQLSRLSADDDRDALVKERISQEYDLRGRGISHRISAGGRDDTGLYEQIWSGTSLHSAVDNAVAGDGDGSIGG